MVFEVGSAPLVTTDEVPFQRRVEGGWRVSVGR